MSSFRYCFRKEQMVTLSEKYFESMDGAKPIFTEFKKYKVLKVVHRKDPLIFSLRILDDKGDERVINAAYFDDYKLPALGKDKDDIPKKRGRPKKKTESDSCLSQEEIDKFADEL